MQTPRSTVGRVDKAPKEVNVIVSGGGPWGPGTPWPPIPINSSWLIADALPRVIFRNGERPNIRIVLYPEPVPSSWHAIRQALPQFWSGDKHFFHLHHDPDTPSHFPVTAVLHMGMLDKPNEAFRLEQNAFKLGYELPDVDGKRPDEDDLTGGGTWTDIPDQLSTELDIGSIITKVKSTYKDAAIRISYDPARFLCAYEYYTSLAAVYKRSEKRRVLFMHTPIEHESENIQYGVQIVTKVIESMVEELESSETASEHQA
ncbi:peptidase C15, pyroglutamyl peptidase I-like protein [Pseudovirgaria hyperparasitica]|uniref:Peptidase C15, pyroglutamyl peptidase I-like protein n=1 Tax=Pseudovirgaria hyperparasitica TaxID=470096 RepID=A0A6A6VYL6_9PEZI|nr:peptidase C15, pyroglutamyl peptidase I-like protein [Pseudovirgaria hyperparasitica]KAF2754824.1 peptidase C15, pyroglutamyl peptidase I-like protein [Pseudovirgaria hyperparasitica]